MRESVDERLIRLWAGPQGAVKAALAGAGIDALKVFRNPGGLLQDGVSTIGSTSVAWEGNTPVVTFPIPGVADATQLGTGDLERVLAQVRDGRFLRSRQVTLLFRRKLREFTPAAAARGSARRPGSGTRRAPSATP